MSPKKLVIFDCDGVLVDSEPLAMKAYQLQFQRLGMTLRDEEFAKFFGMKQADIIANLAVLTGHLLSDDDRAMIWQDLQRLFESDLQATQGLLPFLEKLQAARCVASSSAMDRIEISLNLCGIKHFFTSSVFSSTMVTHGKPAPDLFLHAAKSMDYAPSDCVVIEDSLPGIQAANAASMRVIGFLGGSHLQPSHSDAMRAQGASAVAESWDQVTDILQNFGIS